MALILFAVYIICFIIVDSQNISQNHIWELTLVTKKSSSYVSFFAVISSLIKLGIICYILLTTIEAKIIISNFNLNIINFHWCKFRDKLSGQLAPIKIKIYVDPFSAEPVFRRQNLTWKSIPALKEWNICIGRRHTT